MVEKISVQIALEGGAEVQRQLEGIGQAGQKAFADISKSAEAAGGFKNLDPSVATAKLKEFGVTGVDEIQKIQKALSTAVRFENFTQGVQSAEAAFVTLGKAAGVAGVAVAAAFVAMAKPTIAFADAINKASDQAVKLGFTLEQFKNFQQDFEKLGVSGSAAAAGFAKFQQALEKAAQADPGSNLALFGQSADAAKAQLDQFLNRLRQMPDGLQRTSLAISQLGEVAGTQFIQGLRAAEGSMTADERKAYELGQSIERLSSAWSKFGTLAFAPGLTAGINVATTAIQSLTTAFGALQRIGQSDLGQKVAGTLQNAFTGLDQIIAGLAGKIAQALGAGPEQAQALQQAILGVGQAGQQAGQQAAQGLQLIADPLTGMPQLVNTTNQALAQTGQAGAQAGQQAAQGFQVWNEELGKAVPATQQVTSATQGATSAVSSFVSQMASITWDTISSAGVAAWNAITGAIQSAIDALLKFIGLKPSGPSTGGGAPGKARGGLLGGRGSGTSDSNLAWVSRGEHIMPAAVVRRPGVLGLLEALRRGGGIPGYADGGAVSGLPFSASVFASVFNTTIDLLKGAVDALRQLQQGFNNSMAGVVDSINRLATPFNEAVNSVVQTIVAAADTLQKLNQAGGNARGGLLGGRGSGTSDSNLAWVSRGEYITPARAVAQPGVLSFLEALRRSGGNLSRVLDGMGRFALGGMIRSPIPAFASGGLAGGSNVTIQFPGLPAIGGLRASSDVVDQLHRAAALAQVRSGGRKPSRYS